MSKLPFLRDPIRVNAAVKQVGSRVVALESLRMYFPTRWTERDLATIESVITVLGYVALVTDDNRYANTKISGYLRVEPDRISQETIDNELYTVLWFKKGSSVIASTDIVMNDNLVHSIYTELLGKGKIPWYFTYQDRPRLFENIGYYNGVDRNGDPAIWSFMAASASRDPDDPQRYYRQRKNPTDDMDTHPPITVGLKLVSYHGSSLISKQGGSYFDAGTTSALANPSERIERTEQMLTQT